jgi:hypothetical protein
VGPCGNIVTVANGFVSLAGAIGLVNGTVTQTGFGFNINNLVKVPAASIGTVLAASGTQNNVVRPSLKFSSGFNGSSVANSASAAGSALKSVGNQITTSAKNVSATVNKTVKHLPNGAAAGAKSGAGSATGSGK